MTPKRCVTEGCTKAGTYARGMCCAHYAKWKKARPPGTARPRRAAAESDPELSARISLPEFLASLAASVPPLPGALCRAHVELFDRTVWQRDRQKDTREARVAALAICQECPAGSACHAWLDSLPADERPHGVVAGQIITPGGRPRGRPNTRVERAELFASLRRSGLSYRAIAASTGASELTVRRALAEAATALEWGSEDSNPRPPGRGSQSLAPVAKDSAAVGLYIAAPNCNKKSPQPKGKPE